MFYHSFSFFLFFALVVLLLAFCLFLILSFSADVLSTCLLSFSSNSCIRCLNFITCSLSSNSACCSSHSNFCCSTTNSIRSLPAKSKLFHSNPFSACCHGGFHRWSTFNLNSRHIATFQMSLQTSFQISFLYQNATAQISFQANPNGTVATMRLPLSNKCLANLSGAVAKIRPTTSTVAKCDCPKIVSLPSQRWEQTSLNSTLNKISSSKYISSGMVANIATCSSSSSSTKNLCTWHGRQNAHRLSNNKWHGRQNAAGPFRFTKSSRMVAKMRPAFQTSGTVAKNVPNHTSFKPNCWGG